MVVGLSEPVKITFLTSILCFYSEIKVLREFVVSFAHTKTATQIFEPHFWVFKTDIRKLVCKCERVKYIGFSSENVTF